MGVCILGRGRTMTPHTKWGNNSPYGGWPAEGCHFPRTFSFYFYTFFDFSRKATAHAAEPILACNTSYDVFPPNVHAFWDGI